jgi:hypothetical protein
MLVPSAATLFYTIADQQNLKRLFYRRRAVWIAWEINWLPISWMATLISFGISALAFQEFGNDLGEQFVHEASCQFGCGLYAASISISVAKHVHHNYPV